MGISEFALHNVLRTYTRQERLGQVQRPRPRAGAPTQTSDQLSLSQAARRAKWLGDFAGELVDAREPTLSPDERSTRVRQTKEELFGDHADELADESISSEEWASKLRSTYFG